MRRRRRSSEEWPLDFQGDQKQTLAWFIKKQNKQKKHSNLPSSRILGNALYTITTLAHNFLASLNSPLAEGIVPVIDMNLLLQIEQVRAKSYISNWNARGLRDRLSDFRQLIYKYKFSTLAIQKSRVPRTIRLTKYEIFHSISGVRPSRPLLATQKSSHMCNMV